MRLIPGASNNAGRGSSGMTLIEKKKEDDQQSELDRIIEEDRKNQERLQNEEAQRQADQQTKQNESAVDKVLNKVSDYAVTGFGVASKIVKGGLDAYNTASDFIIKKAEEHPKVTEAVLSATPLGDAYKIKKQVNASIQDAFDKGKIDEKTKNWLDDPVLTALNTETGAKITGVVAQSTSNLPLKAIASVKAIGDNTYDEAMSSLLQWRNDPSNPRWQKLLADVQDSGAQSAIGVLLSVGTSMLTRSPKAGQTVGMTYYGAISAESQRQEKGSVTSKKNIAVDTVGDIMLGGLVEGSLKAILKDSAKRTVGNVAKQTVKGGIVEGSTEVSQTMVKYANDYNDAKSEEEKLAVIDKTKNYVLNGGLLNEFLVGGISGGTITGFATMAVVAAAGDSVEPSLQPKKGSAEEEKKGAPQLSADVDIAKLRDQAIEFKDSAEKNQEDPVAIEQYTAVRDALSDYEIAFKERPVYIAENEQESPLMQIETVAYPDGKFSYRFSADAGGTAFDSNFDNQNTVATQEEAIKKASDEIKSWVEGQIATASDGAEAMKFQRIFDEADALITGKAKFESAMPTIKESSKTNQENKIEESDPQSEFDALAQKASQAREAYFAKNPDAQITGENANDGAFLTADEQARMAELGSLIENKKMKDRGIEKEVDMKRLVKMKRELRGLGVEVGENESIKSLEGKLKQAKEKPSSSTPKNDDKTGAKPVDKYEKKEEKTVTKKEEKPESVEAKVEKDQQKEKTESKNDTELEATKKTVRRFGKKTLKKDTEKIAKEKSVTIQEQAYYQKLRMAVNEAYNLDEDGVAVDEKKVDTLSDEAFEAGKQLGFAMEFNDSFGSYDISLRNKKSDILEAQGKFVRMAKYFGFDLQANSDGTITMYHGTNEENSKSILSEAFESGSFFSPSINEEYGGVNGASYYGDKVLRADIDPRRLVFRIEGEFYVEDEEAISNVKILDTPTASDEFVGMPFVRASGKKQERKLIVIHNLTEQKLRFADRVGGLANPSMAVIDPSKTPFDNYGDVSLIPRSEVLRGEKTHLADAYSPRFPSVHSSMSYENFKRLEAEMLPIYQELGENAQRVYDNNDDIIREIENSPSVAYKFLKEAGVKVNPKAKIYEYSTQIVENKLDDEFQTFLDDFYQKFGVEEKIFAGYTPSGNRRYKPLTAEEASKIMSREKEEGWNYGLGSYRSKVAPVKRTPEAIKKEADRLVSKSDFEKVRDEYDNEIWSILEALKPFVKNEDSNNFIENDRQHQTVGAILAGERYAMEYFNAKYEGVPSEILNRVFALKEKLMEMPSEYFEVKFRRAFPLMEFSKAIVPKETGATARAILEKNGIEIIEYEKGKRQEKLIELLQDETFSFALKDRSTRGKDGKFTGSKPDAITDKEIEEQISYGEAFSIVKRIQKETNPALRSILQFKIAEQFMLGKNSRDYVTDGYFSSQKALIAISTKVSRKEFEYVLRHEINHAAFALLPRDKQMDIEEWYIDLAKDPKREQEFVAIYDGKPGLVQEYLDLSKKNIQNWDGSRMSPVTFMADETFNRYVHKLDGKPKSALEKAYQDIVDAIVRLLERINQAIFKNRRLSAAAKKRATLNLYKNVFNAKSGDFTVPAGMLEMLRGKGITPGKIAFGDTGSGSGTAFSKKEATTPKEETKTVRFAKIISRRRELRALKRKREADFLATEEGNQAALEAEVARENYEAPNENIVQGIRNSTYFQKEGSISDAMGEGYLMEKKGRYVIAEYKRREVYINRGYRTVMEIDSMAAEAGFERGQDYLQDQFDRRNLPESTESSIRRILKDRDRIYGKAEEELAKLEIELSQAKEDKGAFYQGMRVGSEIMRKNYTEKLKTLRGRKEKVRAAKQFFNLSDSDFKKIGGNRELLTMTEGEFKGFLNHIQVQAEKVILRSQAMELLVGQIQEKQLKRYDNLRRAMNLPVIDKMTTEQIKEFDKALEFSQEGDEFFTQRQLETVKNTELIGIKTVREARDRLAARLNMPLSALGAIKVAPSLDRLRFDAAIAEANPFYGMLVAETNTATLEAEGRFIAIEEEINRLIKAARKSRSRGITERLIPKDSRIFAYLEAEDKSGLAADMTPEELMAAEFIRKRYEEMRDYLVEREMLKQYRENYITHVRKGFLETLRDDGIVAAFRDMIAQQQEDEATFNILSGDTGNILPLEKFFQFSLKRTGGIKPTENVAAAFLAYTQAFEKKRSLDKLIPKLDIYTYSIEPKRATKTGLLMDRSLKRFLNDYLNNKKGRRFDFGGFLRQGGKADLALRSVRALTTLLDLGLSIPGGIASNVGEQATNFVQMGAKAYIKGSARYATFRGRRFLKQYRNFTGKNPWTELAEASNGVGDRFNSGLFILFRDAQVRANQQFLLGSITDEEYKTGEITPQRLGELNIAMGRWRVVEGAKSIIGSTSAGGVLAQYKTWAVPIFRTTLKDITTLVGNIKDQGLAKSLYSKEGAELFRSIMVLGTVALIVKALISSDKDTEKEKTFFEKLVDKSVRDLLSTIGVFDPTFFASEPRVLAFFGDLAAAIKSIGMLEEYTDDAPDGSYDAGGLKGVKKLKKTVTPMLLKQFDTSGNLPDKAASVEKYLKQGLSTEEAVAKASEELKLDPESDTYESDLSALEREATRQETAATLGDKTTARLEKARLNTTKMRILTEAKKDMTDQEFQDYIEKLYDGKIISKTVFGEFWNY